MEAPLSPAAAHVLDELSLERNVRSVWLIGSQANDTATEHSDWDLLVFRSDEPIPTNKRQATVDVLWVGPSGRNLLEGQGEGYGFMLSDLEWTETTSDGIVRYRGKRFIEYPEGTAVDTDAPRFH